jgi:hypothetical protein
MDPILDLLNPDDLCAAGLLVGVLAYIGSRMVADRPRARRWGSSLGALAVLAVCVYGYVRCPSRDSHDLLWLALRGLFAGGLVLGASWMALPAVVGVYQATLGSVFEGIGRSLRAARARAAERRARRQEEERRRRADEEYRRGAPERERAAREAAAAQKRRADARAACEVLYNLHAPEIAVRFSRDLFNDFVTRHLGDNQSPEYVEERARQLQEIIRCHVERIEPPKKQWTVEELAAWYKTMRETIERQPIDDRQKRVQVAQLNLRYRDLMNDLMETLEP